MVNNESMLCTANSGEAHNSLGRQPNPNNPMEYCSTIPPLQQAAGSLRQPPPTVMVPVGVLKREGNIICLVLYKNSICKNSLILR